MLISYYVNKSIYSYYVLDCLDHKVCLKLGAKTAYKTRSNTLE